MLNIEPQIDKCSCLNDVKKKQPIKFLFEMAEILMYVKRYTVESYILQTQSNGITWASFRGF